MSLLGPSKCGKKKFPPYHNYTDGRALKMDKKVPNHVLKIALRSLSLKNSLCKMSHFKINLFENWSLTSQMAQFVSGRFEYRSLRKGTTSLIGTSKSITSRLTHFENKKIGQFDEKPLRK